MSDKVVPLFGKKPPQDKLAMQIDVSVNVKYADDEIALVKLETSFNGGEKTSTHIAVEPPKE